MRQISLKIFFFIIVGFTFAIQVNAQLCGTYTTTLNIKDFNNKPVENAVVQLLPIEKDETRGKTFVRSEKDLSKFSITFNEGHEISAKYKLLISADGYETFEKVIKFPHCRAQVFDFQLKADKNLSSNDLSRIIFDIVEIFTNNLKIISG